MKKLLSITIIMALVLTCAVVPVSAATSSPELGDTITDVTATQPNGSPASVVLEKATASDSSLAPSDSDDLLIALCDVEIEGNPTFPITIKGRIRGLKAGRSVYVLAKTADSNKATKIAATVPEDGVISFKIDKAYTKIAVIGVADDGNKSDPTGESDILLYVGGGALVLIGVAAFLLLKKKSAE